MEKVIIKINDILKEYDIESISQKDNIERIKFFAEFDNMMVAVNKSKYNNSKVILNYLDELRVPRLIDSERINLFSLFNFFQKKYVYHDFKLDLTKYSEKVYGAIGYPAIDVACNPNNFPHLIGIRGERDELNRIISREKPQEFLDGVLHQWILLNVHEGFKLDYDKLAVFHWIHSTITAPTYIFTKEAIKKENTKFNADIIMVKKIFNSPKQAFHIVGLIQEKGSRYTFNSQFAISKQDEKRFYKMFNQKKVIYDFFKK